MAWTRSSALQCHDSALTVLAQDDEIPISGPGSVLGTAQLISAESKQGSGCFHS